MRKLKLLNLIFILVLGFFLTGCNFSISKYGPFDHSNDGNLDKIDILEGTKIPKKDPVDPLDLIDEEDPLDLKDEEDPLDLKEEEDPLDLIDEEDPLDLKDEEDPLDLIEEEEEDPLDLQDEEDPLDLQDEFKEFDYTVIRSGVFNLDYQGRTLVMVETYLEYLEFINNLGLEDDLNDFELNFYNESNLNLEYDQEYFETRGLIFYGEWENSGSIGVEISSILLDKDNVLTINVRRYLPFIGTCDMKYNGFRVEYIKPDEEIAKLDLVYENISQRLKEFRLSAEDKATQAKLFLEENFDEIILADIYVEFNYDSELKNLSFDEQMVFLEKQNQLNYEKYGLERLGLDFYISLYSPYCTLRVNNLEDLDLDPLIELAGVDDFVEVYLYYLYNSSLIDANPVP